MVLERWIVQRTTAAIPDDLDLYTLVITLWVNRTLQRPRLVRLPRIKRNAPNRHAGRASNCQTSTDYPFPL